MEPAKPASPFEPPGGILIWFIVILELLTFGLGLIVFAVQKNAEPEVFANGRHALNQTVALGNTLILLTGGWFMVNALGSLQREDHRTAARWTVAAGLAGGAFLALKGCEYSDKLAQGLTLRHDSFFTLYWLLTGFHFLHVAVAMVILTVIGINLHRGSAASVQVENVEAGGIFWHLCDLIWLLLYPVLYLVP